jgi:hypothetical protein
MTAISRHKTFAHEHDQPAAARAALTGTSQSVEAHCMIHNTAAHIRWNVSSIEKHGADDAARLRAITSTGLQAWSPYDVWRTQIFEARRARTVRAGASRSPEIQPRKRGHSDRNETVHDPRCFEQVTLISNLLTIYATDLLPAAKRDESFGALECHGGMNQITNIRWLRTGTSLAFYFWIASSMRNTSAARTVIQ